MCAPIHPAALQCNALCLARALARSRALLPASAPLLRLVRSLTADSWRKRYESAAARDLRLSRRQRLPHTALGRILPPIRDARQVFVRCQSGVFGCHPTSDLRTKRVHDSLRAPSAKAALLFPCPPRHRGCNSKPCAPEHAQARIAFRHSRIGCPPFARYARCPGAD